MLGELLLKKSPAAIVESPDKGLASLQRGASERVFGKWWK
jgi:hypothetical protein